MDELDTSRRAYEEYVKQARRTNSKILSDAEWQRKVNEEYFRRRDANQKREETILDHEENNNKKKAKRFSDLARDQETVQRQYARSQRELSEVMKKNVKDFLGIRSDLKFKDNPATTVTNVARTNVNRMINFDDLPPVFKGVEKALAGFSDALTIKVIDPLFKKAGQGIKGVLDDRKNKKFLLENDPRFVGKDKKEAKLEINNLMKERKAAATELSALQTKQAKLSELGGYNLEIEDQIQNIQDYLNGVFEQNDRKEEPKEKGTSAQKSSEKSDRSTREPRGSRSDTICSCEQWFKTLDASLVGIITNVVKVDNRLVAIQGVAAEMLQRSIQNGLEEEARYERDKQERDSQFEGKEQQERIQPPKEEEKEEGSFFGEIFEGIAKNLAGVFAGIASGFGAVVSGVAGLMSGLPLLTAGLAAIGAAIGIGGAIWLATKAIEAIGNASIMDADGNFTGVGNFIDKSLKVLGNESGLKPESEMTSTEKIKKDGDKGFLGISNLSSHNANKDQIIKSIGRGVTRTPEEAAQIKESFGIEIPQDLIESKKSINEIHKENNQIKKEAKSKGIDNPELIPIPVTKVEPSPEVKPQPKKSAETLKLEEAQLKKDSDKRRIKEVAKQNGLNTNSVKGIFENGELVGVKNFDGKTYPVGEKLNKAVETPAPTTKAYGDKLEESNTKLAQTVDDKASAQAVVPVVNSSPSNSVVNNTSAMAGRTKSRFAEDTFSRMTGNRAAAW